MDELRQILPAAWSIACESLLVNEVKLIAMDDARALLNSLMGNDRNEHAEQRRVRKFTDGDICKHYLLGLCPHDLFKNTKMDLGACSQEHNENMKDEFDADSDIARYKRKWRRGLINQCKRSLLDVDRRIALNRDRIAREKDVTFGASEESKQELARLKEEVADKFKDAEKAADDGKFDESREIMKGSEATQRKIEDFELKRFEKYKKDNICDICGLIVDGEEIEAMKTGRGWHSNGRQHIGYNAIREKLKELDRELDEDKRNGVPSPTPSPVKETKAPDKDSKRRKSPSRSKRKSPSRSKRKRSRSRSVSRRRRPDDRKRSRSRSPSRRKKKDGKKRSPTPKRSRSRGRRDRSRDRRKRSRSKRKGSRSLDKKKSKTAQKSSPKRRSRSSDGGKDKKVKKALADDHKAAKSEAPKSEPAKEEVKLPVAAPSPPPEPDVEPPKPTPEPEPAPDIDFVRPRVAFFMGLKPGA